ncbi:MAG TPA: YqgE/AlgH family protein [Stellaceae bacterium]|nr:YqgE/AlgH family protein [Stellaceae bacterium]
MAFLRRLQPRLLHTATLLLAAGVLLGASPSGQQDSASLAGQLLVAAPDMGDPRFVHAVILLLRQDDTGALGIVLNHPVEQRSVASLLAAAGDHDTGVDGSIEVYAGGPVEPQLGFVVHSPDYHDAATLMVGTEVAMTADKQILRDIGHHKGPKKALFAFGYAGWSAGQLAGEIAEHDWFTTTGDPKLIFDEDRDHLWDEAMARRTRDL